jgi:outer membrane protein OmpA-like peptidoglycan-associated protein
MVALAQTPAPAADQQAPAPVAVSMPYTGEVEFGLMGVMGQNADQAGRYSGFNTTGVNVVGGFDFMGRDAWYSGGTGYFEFNGSNLVLQTGNHFGSGIANDQPWANSVTNNFSNNGSLGLKFGQQGTWSFGLSLDSITYTGNVIDSLYTIYGNQGVLNNGLAPFGGATSQTAATPGAVTSAQLTAARLAATGAMQPFQTGTRRDAVGTDFKYIWNDWTFTGAFVHEHKEGSMEEAAYSAYGGTAFAMPINYDTNRYDASAAYNTRLFQGVFQYTFSQFTDNNLFVTLPYPYANTAKPYQLSAAYSTPPSNNAQYLTMMLATNAIPLTRINLNARVGVEKQNDTFAPNTADPGASGLVGVTPFQNLNSAVQGTGPLNSPDITATVYQVKLSASTHPIPDIDINAHYGVDGRSVDVKNYAVYGSGTGSDSSPGSAAPYAFVVPQDWLKQNAGADLTYKLIPSYNTRLTVGYRFDATDRSNAQVGHSWTNTASIAVLSDLGPQLDGKLSFDYADRSGNLSYLAPWLNLDGPNAGPTYSGAYYQAPMTSESVTARLNYMPLDSLNADVFLQFKNENYTYPGASNYTAPNGSVTIAPLTGVGTGVKQDYALTVGPDINYRPNPNLNLHFFYTYELLFYNNLGNGACATSNTGACLGSAGYFQNKYTSSTNTAGFSAEWQVNPKLKLKGDYTLSYGSVMFGEFNGVFVANPTASYQNVSNYPDIDSLMNSVRLTATYEVVPNVDMILQGAFTSFHNNDWNDTANAIQTAGAASVSILTPGYAAPNYAVGMIMAGMKIKFGAPPPPPPAVAAAPAPVMQAARSYLVFFDWDKATLTDRARQIVKEAADNSTHVQYTRIDVNGYTDTSGTPQYNNGLSIRRADTVKAELIKDGVPAGSITTQGYGETHLLVPTAAGVREPQNRRVEIVIH